MDLDIIAEHCEHFSGADLKGLLYNAQISSIHDAQQSNTKVSNSTQEYKYDKVTNEEVLLIHGLNVIPRSPNDTEMKDINTMVSNCVVIRKL